MNVNERVNEMFEHRNPDRHKFKVEPGLNEDTIRAISLNKNEPEWMLQFRLKAFEVYNKLNTPKWGADLSPLDPEKIIYYAVPDAKHNSKSWDDVPEDIKKTFQRLGIPEAEQKYLAGTGSQYDSLVVYHKLKEELQAKGVIFEDMDVALQKYPDLVKEYFMTKCIPITLHKYIALHGAVWSGGTFIYIPENVKVEMPLQAYFRMNTESFGQFEHTLIIVEKNAELHYLEGCSAPRYNSASLHAGCVELFVKEGARLRYSSVENWSKNVYNLNTKRAIVEKNGVIEWITGNMGCLTGETKIFTNPKGPINIREINAGDYIFAFDEKTKNLKKSLVKNKIFSGEKEVFKVEAGGREIEATSNHPFLTMVRRKNKSEHKKGFFYYEWKPLEMLREGDPIVIAKRLPIEGKPYELPEYNYNQYVNTKNQYSRFKINISHLFNKSIKWPKETNNNFMWFLGIILGDGHINPDKGNEKINIAIHQNEDTRPKLIEVIKDLFDYGITQMNERSITIDSKSLSDILLQLGLGGNANTKRIPDWIFTLPEDQILSFIAGYLESDGHTGKSGIYLTSINKEILERIKLLAIMCGFGISRIFKHGEGGEVIIMGRKCNSSKSWRILLNGPKIKKLPVKGEQCKKDLVEIKTRRNYSGIKGFNLYAKFNEEIGFARINKITPMGIKPTYDIEVENCHNFVANGLIVHNSKVSMVYPCSMLIGEGARADHLSIGYAGKGQIQDIGAKVYHLAPNTSSIVKSKSISKNGGITRYRGLLTVGKNAVNAKSKVQCDALMLDNISKSDTIPYMDIKQSNSDIAHEATVGKISNEQIFYLMSRGLTEEQATQMIVNGFIEPIVKELPIEYAVELNRLIELEIEGGLG